MCHRDAEYNYQDAALASLFVACKVEDTIKKSREILCAAHNIKYPDHPLAQDDKVLHVSPWASKMCNGSSQLTVHVPRVLSDLRNSSSGSNASFSKLSASTSEFATLRKC